MKKKTIRIKFVDFWKQFDPENNFFTQILQERYHVELSSDPQYVFYSNFSRRQNHLLYNGCVKIFYTQENLAPDFNFCDYGIGYEHMTYRDRYFRYPLYYRYQKDFHLMESKHLITDEEIGRKDGFCSMVVSNRRAIGYREQFFDLLCGYKKVDSGGRYRNNIGRPYGVKNKREFQARHKFALCFENSSHDGYTTEKIIQAFAAGTVPVYWGDPSIGEFFNRESFINAGDYASAQEAVDAVIRVDSDSELYKKMLRMPALKYPERDSLENVNRNFREFLYAIFDQPVEKAFRRNRVYWGERYEELYRSMRGAYLREQKALDMIRLAAGYFKPDYEGDRDIW